MIFPAPADLLYVPALAPPGQGEFSTAASAMRRRRTR